MLNATRSFRLISLLLISLSVASFAQQSSAPDSSGKDAGAILSKAASLVDLQAQGAGAFLMLANVTLRKGGKSVDGVYAMAASGPGQFRKVFRFPNFDSTEILSNGTIYRKRSTEGLPLGIWQLQNLMSVPESYRPTSQWKIGAVKTEKSGSVELNCVSALRASPMFSAHILLWAKEGPPEAKFCVNAATGEPFSIDRSSIDYHVQSVHERFEFSDYQEFEGKRFPRKLSFQAKNGDRIEVQVQKLIRSQTFPADEFVGLPASRQSKFCEWPDISGYLLPSSREFNVVGRNRFEVDIYFRIAASGGVEYAQVVQSSDPLRDKEFVNWFVGTHFPVQSCSGTPIPYETVVTLASGG
jgi:hypothetical protein